MVLRESVLEASRFGKREIGGFTGFFLRNPFVLMGVQQKGERGGGYVAAVWQSRSASCCGVINGIPQPVVSRPGQRRIPKCDLHAYGLRRADRGYT